MAETGISARPDVHAFGIPECRSCRVRLCIQERQPDTDDHWVVCSVPGPSDLAGRPLGVPGVPTVVTDPREKARTGSAFYFLRVCQSTQRTTVADQQCPA